MRRDKILRTIYNNAIQRPNEYFDFPDYGGLPTDVASTLSPEFVDGVQEMWDKRKRLNQTSWVRQTLDLIIAKGDIANREQKDKQEEARRIVDQLIAAKECHSVDGKEPDEIYSLVIDELSIRHYCIAHYSEFEDGDGW